MEMTGYKELIEEFQDLTSQINEVGGDEIVELLNKRNVLMTAMAMYPPGKPSKGFDEGVQEGKNYITGDETRITILAALYEESTHNACIVATICDEVIDRTGALLGKVRGIVREGKSCTSCKWRQTAYKYKCEMCTNYSEFKRDTD